MEEPNIPNAKRLMMDAFRRPERVLQMGSSCMTKRENAYIPASPNMSRESAIKEFDCASQPVMPSTKNMIKLSTRTIHRILRLGPFGEVRSFSS